MMDGDDTIAVLNALLSLEQRSIAPRISESTVFVSLPAVDDVKRAARIGEANRDRQSALARLIFSLGGQPGLREMDVQSADLHFQELRSAMRRLTSGCAALLEAYRAAADRVADEPRAASLVARHIVALERQLADLQRVFHPAS